MKKIILIISTGILMSYLSTCFYSCDTNSSEVKAGYDFILKNLKSPNSATLESGAYHKKMKEIVEEHCKVILPSCISVGQFKVSAQNSFGTIITQTYYVFYKNGIPCHMETDESIDRVANSGQGYILNTALEMNGCSCN